MKTSIYTGERLEHGVALRPRRAFFVVGSLFAAFFLAFATVSAPAQVVINEIMYHPEDGWHTNASGAWVLFTNETEYVEIYNSGSNAVDLSTYRLDNGVAYDFPADAILSAGSYLVVCQNISAFKSVYTNVQWTTTNCQGNYKGSLNNGGERVTLSRLAATQWIEVASIQYIDGGPSDGDGYSLELIHPGFANIRNQFYGAWAAATNAGAMTNGIRYAGTPGRTNSVYNTNALPVVGDVIHNPPLPPAGSSVLITCKAEARTTGALERVTLLWRWDADSLTTGCTNRLTMYDNGLNGDAVAGDGTYSRMFPPYGYPVTTNGQLLEFRISALDKWGGSVTNPAVSAATVTNIPYSYLCYFGEDSGFNGEYTTYHMLMSATNRAAVEGQGQYIDDIRLDGTFITSDGEIFYNCGLRHRGGSSTYSPFNYKVRFPAGRNLDGYKSIDLNHVDSMHQYIGMKIMGSIGYGAEAPNVKLCRLWLNSTDKASQASHGIYCRHEPVDQALAKAHYGSDNGNFYSTDGDVFNGNLTYFSTNIDDYKKGDQIGGVPHAYGGYGSDINNPYTAWHDLTNMIGIIDQAPSTFPSTLTNRIDPREWGRYFGGEMAMDNNEAGVNQPPGPPSDELRMYAGSENGIFHIGPHDCDTILGGDSSNVWGWDGYNTADIIENPPTVKFYRHDCLDIIANIMSDANMNSLFDQMGSAATSRRAGWLTNIQNQRTGIQGVLGTRDVGPTAPTNMVLTNVTALSVELRWQDVGSDEEWFEIWRSPDGVAWKYCAFVESNVTTYVNRGLSENTTYFYKVRAVDQQGESAFTSQKSIVTPFLSSDAILRNYLRVSEIMYNPTNTQDYEFIELMNTHTSQSIDLSGVYFTPGEPFTDTFAFTNGTSLGPSAFLVLVKSATAFTNRYPGVPYYGQYTGGMGNDGERIRIRATNAATIIDFTYHDWYPSADGFGHSLVLWAPANTTNDPTSSKLYDRMEHVSLWRPSTYMYGSPGSNDPAPPFGAVVINEVLSHQDTEPPGDWIELYNPTTNAINIGYWCLSDNVNTLTNYRIPPGTVLGSNGYYVVTEYWKFGTNSFASGSNGFALSELGDQVILSSGDTNGLTSYRTTVDFGAGERDVAFGRYTRSDGEVDFVAMSSQTSNNANAYPSVGPIVINEIMYNPSAGGKEYVELYNITSSNIPLFDVDHPTNTWNFDGAMDFTFPTNTYIGSNRYALVVGIDPNEFRAMFGITNPAIQVFGPYVGDLANGGESIKLYKPGSPETNGVVPRYRVDRVQYGDTSPWPVGADNGGASLERRVPSAYGNDPTNWAASTMFGTPGGPNNTNGLPTVNFATTSGSGYESNRTETIWVTLTPAATNAVSVWYTMGGGTATDNVDYARSNGIVLFAAGVTSNTLSLAISNDAVRELDETVLITLTNVSANAWLGGRARFTWTIVDTETNTVLAPTIAPGGTNVFSNSVTVAITTNGPTSAIYYTTDGSIPDSGDNIYTGSVVLTSSARITAKSYLGSYMTSSCSTALFVEQAPPWQTDPRIGEIPVSQSSDDAIQRKLNGIILNEAFLPFGRSTTGTDPWTGVRFTGINIGNDVTVTNAYIQFTVYAATNTTTTNLIWGQLSNNAPTFVSSDFDISSRKKTTTSVFWSISASQTWDPPGLAGTVQRTPDLAGVMNEIAALPTWSVSNAMVFVFSNAPGGRRLVYSWDGDTNYAPMLCYWTVPKSYWLGVQTNGPGVIAGGNVWVEFNSNVAVIATASPHYQFGSWTGDVGGVDTSSANITVTMTNSRNMVGSFVDILWTNGATEAWLDYYYPGTNSYNDAALSDTDGDGHKAWQEYIAGTDPTDVLSVLKISGLRFDLSGNVISWPGVTGRFYSVFRSTNMLLGWPGSPFTNNLSTAPTNGTVSCTDSGTNNPAFYQIKVQ